MSRVTKKIRLEYIDPTTNSCKFYEVITTPDNQVVTNWGRIGTKGQNKFYTYASKWAAQEKSRDLVTSKINKGYKIVNEQLSAEVNETETEDGIHPPKINAIELWMADF